MRQLLDSPAEVRAPVAPLRPQRPYLWALPVLLLYFCLAFGDALVAVPWCDEAWLSNPALTFLRHGYFGTPILTPFAWGPPLLLPHIDHRTYWIMPLQMVAEAGWFRVFGYSLLALRMLSIFWGGIALSALYLLVRKITRRDSIALLALLIAATDYFFLTRAMDGRMDIMAAAFMLCAMAAYVLVRETSLSRAALFAGIFGAGAAFTHPVGGFFTFCGLGVLALLHDRRRLRFSHGVLFAVPFLAIGSLWGLYIAQDLSAFRTQMAGNAHGRWLGITDLYGSVYRELRFKYFQAYGLNTYDHFTLHHLRLIALFLYIASVSALAFVPRLRQLRGAKLILTISVIYVVGGLVFDGAKRWYYLTYVLPFFAASLALCTNWLWRERRFLRVPVAVVGAAFLAIQVGGTLYRIHKNDYQNVFLPAAEFAIAHDPDHRLIHGGGELGFVMGFPDYLVDDISLGYFSGRKAALVFVPETYWGLWMEDLKTRDPAVGKFIAQTLHNQYQLAFKNSGYRIYLQKH